jgi:thiol:disulfide interchange protein
MTTTTTGNNTGAVPVRSASFERFAGACAILAGIAGFLYAVAFIILQNVLLSGLFLMLVGLFTSAALVAVYQRLRETDASFALFALLLGLAGALGSAVHGGYDLANAINPPSSSMPDLPNPIDPRGLLTFGVTGIALFIVAWLIGRGGQFPRGLGYLGYVSAVLLVVLYLGRLIVFNPTNPVILVPALLNSFLVNPIFYLWLGLALLRRQGA